MAKELRSARQRLVSISKYETVWISNRNWLAVDEFGSRTRDITVEAVAASAVDR